MAFAMCEKIEVESHDGHNNARFVPWPGQRDEKRQNNREIPMPICIISDCECAESKDASAGNCARIIPFK